MDTMEGRGFGGSRSFSDDIDFLFDSMLCRGRPILMPSRGTWHPPMDVLETDREYIIILEIAGIRREDVKLTFEAGRLTIRGLRRDVDRGQQRHYHVMEIDYGPFERSVKLLIHPVERIEEAWTIALKDSRPSASMRRRRPSKP